MNILYLVPLFPILGLLLLLFFNNQLSEKLITLISITSIILSVCTTAYVVVDFYNVQNINFDFNQIIWQWIKLGNLNIPIALTIDGLSLVMISIITGIGLLIQIYASWYMHGEYSYLRFFAYINLFIASMLMLILANNMLVMYMGWEMVGLCSYLLIGFYHTISKNYIAAMKSFIITRSGDILLALALFFLYNKTGTLNFHELEFIVPTKFTNNSMLINLIALMLLGGAIGKSAQFPLYTWLPEAMVGPTPVSALIHSATMVTAGVYLIARMHSLFIMAPTVLFIVGIIGITTALLASCAALVQVNIKKILAYSTISQIGYMFLALGVQAWHAAIFHLMIHAFFKALLFLSAGSVIISCHHEQNIFNMGGLRKSNPFIYICFLVGGAALSALPIITSGFYSKEKIFCYLFDHGHNILILFGLLGSLLTSMYTFRMIFIIFHGKLQINTKTCSGINHTFPLICLMILSSFIGSWIKLPLQGVLPFHVETQHNGKLFIELISGTISIIGVIIASVLWIYQHNFIKIIVNYPIGRLIHTWWYHAWGIDWIYNKVFTKSYLFITNLISTDPLSKITNIIVILIRKIEFSLKFMENGQLSWYILSISVGAIFVIAFLIFM